MSIISLRIVSLQRVDHPRVLACADIQIGDLLVLSGVRLIKGSQSEPFRVQGPQVTWLDENSSRRYATTCKLKKSLRKLILQALISHLQREGGVL